MIIQENFYIGNKQFTKTYSDRKVLIHGGMPDGDYEEAVDPAEFGRTYIETDIPIDNEEATAEEIVDILTGEEE